MRPHNQAAFSRQISLKLLEKGGTARAGPKTRPWIEDRKRNYWIAPGFPTPLGMEAPAVGMRSFWPTLICVVLKLLAACRSFTETLCFLAMPLRVSPDFTV